MAMVGKGWKCKILNMFDYYFAKVSVLHDAVLCIQFKDMRMLLQYDF